MQFYKAGVCFGVLNGTRGQIIQRKQQYEIEKGVSIIIIIIIIIITTTLQRRNNFTQNFLNLTADLFDKEFAKGPIRLGP